MCIKVVQEYYEILKMVKNSKDSLLFTINKGSEQKFLSPEISEELSEHVKKFYQEKIRIFNEEFFNKQVDEDTNEGKE